MKDVVLLTGAGQIGMAVLLEEVGKVIARGGVGVTISIQSGHRMPRLGNEIDAFIKTCLRSVRQVAPAQRTKWQMSQNYL